MIEATSDNLGQIDRIAPLLLRWYRQHRRTLPWRSDRPNPYHVLVSEAMLQQTQVATVIGYFTRFIDVFPTVEALAASDEQQVLTLWQGLGYYRRARNLHAAARAIVSEHDGNVPRTVGDLLSLPGIGRYTAGAIASIAYGAASPILDGNVARVLARVEAIDQSIDDTAVRHQLWQLAEQAVPHDAPGDFNQAMMELGALVCTPKQPACSGCPIAKLCRARLQGREADLPVRIAKKKPAPVQHHIIAIRKGSRYLFEQRPDDGLWSRMWQLPTREQRPGASGDALGADDLATWARTHLGLELGDLREAAAFDHATTHRAIRFTLWDAGVAAGRLRPKAGQWRRLDDVSDLPLAKPQKVAVRRLQAGQ